MPDTIERVRHFNRFYTEQIGVLSEHLLSSSFSLTEARVLYEMAHRKDPTAAEIAAGLQLDRGYLSRILRSFQKQDLIKRKTSTRDKRESLLSLTAKGRSAFASLDQRSNQEVASLLQRIPPGDQQQLTSAMNLIEQLLAPKPATSSRVRLREARPGDLGWIVHRHGVLYWQEYRYDLRFEALVAKIVGGYIEHFIPERERCWVAEREGTIVGSVFLVQKSKSIAKLRLLYVEPFARGAGIGERLIRECITFARKAGYKKITLWTQSELLAAGHLYKKAGFVLVREQPHKSFGRNDLVAQTWELNL